MGMGTGPSPILVLALVLYWYWPSPNLGLVLTLALALVLTLALALVLALAWVLYWPGYCTGLGIKAATARDRQGRFTCPTEAVPSLLCLDLGLGYRGLGNCVRGGPQSCILFTGFSI